MDNNEPKQRMDRKAQARLRSLGKIFTRVMVAICALLIVAEFALHRHGEVGIDDNHSVPGVFRVSGLCRDRVRRLGASLPHLAQGGLL